MTALALPPPDRAEQAPPAPAVARGALALRPYQRAAIDAAFAWCAAYEGHPLIVVPTGGGKSLIMGSIIKEALDNAPGTRALVLAHRAELIAQNVKAVTSVLPLGSIGIYSAGLKRRDTEHAIIVGGIQSLGRHAFDVGAFDLILIDEAHLVPSTDDTLYRKFIQAARLQNPGVRFVGLTATPYRLGTGLLHRGKNPLFTDVAYEAPVRDLIRDGYLCRLISKATLAQLDTAGVATRGGEFVAGQLEAAVDVADTTAAVVREIAALCTARRKLLVFCAGVAHAEHVADALCDAGWPAAAVHGELSGEVRSNRLAAFRSGQLRAVTSVDVLTTGYDEPAIDAIALLRPTKSPGLYVQMVGRGFRQHPDKADTLILDFAGNVARHGPVDAIEVKEQTPGTGTAPTKTCPGCQSIIYASLRLCPDCQHEFPPPERPPILPSASLAPVLSDEAVAPVWEEVTGVEYFFHQRDVAKTPTLRVEYYHGYRRVASEWVCLQHTGFARSKAEAWWAARSPEGAPATIEAALALADDLRTPVAVATKPDGRYQRVVAVRFADEARGQLPVACWTCAFALGESPDLRCTKWNATPPADVQRTGCDAWTDEEELPF